MKERVAVVTGGAGGIGSAVCRAFARQGVGVSIADMDAVSATELANEITATGRDAIALEVEITSEQSVISAGERTIEHFGRVDFLVHCAGIIIKAPVLELSAEDWSKTLDTHLTGAFLFSKVVGRYLVEQGSGGSVVFISSPSSWRCSTIEIFLVRNGMVAVVNESSSGWMNLPKVEVGSSFRLSRGLRQPVEQSSHSKKGSEQNSSGAHVTLPS